MQQGEIERFCDKIWAYYHAHGRHDLPWRLTTDPYAIVVSEIMLQQTQAARVIPKYQTFLAALPTFADLAKAPTAEVLGLWQGLGYNRRALNLQRLAQIVINEHDGRLPNHPEELVKLPGIGQGTAGSVAAFAFNFPAIFIETNIRRVVIAEFYADAEAVGDEDLVPILEKALDRDNPREWYWALMDYGAYLATLGPNPNRASRHYTRQSRFDGSHRQLRGELLRYFLHHRYADSRRLHQDVADPRLDQALAELTREGFLERHRNTYRLV